MARPKPNSGRVTPKGTKPAVGRTPADHERLHVDVRGEGDNPRWVPITMFGSFGVGIGGIILNYFGVLPGGANNAYLAVGLVLITVGFVAATQYH